MTTTGNPQSLIQVDDETLTRLQSELLDQSSQMAKRIRTVFTLRNIGGLRSVEILASGMYFLSPWDYLDTNVEQGEIHIFPRALRSARIQT